MAWLDDQDSHIDRRILLRRALGLSGGFLSFAPLAFARSVGRLLSKDLCAYLLKKRDVNRDARESNAGYFTFRNL